MVIIINPNHNVQLRLEGTSLWVVNKIKNKTDSQAARQRSHSLQSLSPDGRHPALMCSGPPGDHKGGGGRTRGLKTTDKEGNKKKGPFAAVSESRAAGPGVLIGALIKLGILQLRTAEKFCSLSFPSSPKVIATPWERNPSKQRRSNFALRRCKRKGEISNIRGRAFQ